MFPGRTTPVLFILFVPMGLSLLCLHTTNTTDWSLSLNCWDTGVTSPGNCQWDVVDKRNERVEFRRTSVVRGTSFHCSEKFVLPSLTGEYVYYILLSNKWETALKLQIDDPGEPTVKDCKHEVREGGRVTCECSAQREGKPPPVISWAGETRFPTLHLYDVRREHSKTYTCQMLWGNQTRTVPYSFSVKSALPVSYSIRKQPVTSSLQTSTGVDDFENKEDNTSPLSFEILGAAAAAVLVIVIVTIVIVIIIIRRKRSTRSNPEHNKHELIEITNYGREESNMAYVNYPEVTDSPRPEVELTKPVLYANEETHEVRQTVDPALYGNVETSKGREAGQVDVYAVVERVKARQPVEPELYALVDEQHLKRDNSASHGEKEFSEVDIYAVVNKGANTDPRALPTSVEETYAQVVKSPK